MTSNDDQDRPKQTLTERIRTAVGDRYATATGHEEDKKYQDSFTKSGQAKAAWIIEDLRARKLNVSDFGYLSIGGADGSEIESVMQELPIKYGVLLEYSTAGSRSALQKADDLAKEGKFLHVVTGDAMQRVDECVQWLREKRITGVICSIQAVLHELPRRSPGFDTERFLARVFRNWDNVVFYCREPCAPSGWPDRIEIRYDDLKGETLASVASHVKEALGFEGDVEELTDNWVVLPSDLAIETVVKLFYFQDFAYEMQEKWVSINSDSLINSVSKLLNSDVEPERFNSTSFSRLFNRYVKARTTGNTPKLAPYCFIRLVATRLLPSAVAADPNILLRLDPHASQETNEEELHIAKATETQSFEPDVVRLDSATDSEPPVGRGAGPTLGDLWEASLVGPDGALYNKAETLLVELAANAPKLHILPVTPLQGDVLLACGNSAFDHPFQSTRHMVLAGPTSSGKTTIADIMLVSNSFSNGERTRAIYVAPTRALAQAKFRELRRLLTTINDGVILSTGEDTTDDRRLISGDFVIACLVYEKANIVLSRPSRLLSTVGCVVVDELHMLMDVERGPLLEVLIAKLLMSRDRLEGKVLERSRGKLRIAVISTEDNVNSALLGLLSSQNPDGSDDNVHPLVYTTSHRPIRVHHHLVLPPASGQRDFELVEFTDYIGSDSRRMDGDNMKAFSSQLEKLKVRTDAAQRRSHARGQSEHEHRERMMRFVLSLIDLSPVGRRLLVFVPSQSFAVERARELKNHLVRQGRQENATREADFGGVADDIDDVETARTVADCARYGVWIHHADIDPTLRAKIEAICEEPVGDHATEVIFATTTLAYGINLAVHDVLLFGTKMSAADRSRGVDDKPLSPSEFHNMLGRVGRLGKVAEGGRANFYIIVSADVDPFVTCIRKYYGPIDPAKSQLFVEDDAHLVRKARKKGDLGAVVRGGPQAIKATSISYPFARAALDALRFVNIVDSKGREKTKRPIDELAQFFNHTLFFHETRAGLDPRSSKNMVNNFLEGLEGVIVDCTNPNLSLVDKSDGKPALYSITELGESIINTGTDIRTVEPLAQLRRQLRDAWHDNTPAGATFPLELFILAVVAQREVLRQYAKNCPECRSPHQRFSPDTVAENRSSVQRIFAKSVAQVSAHCSAEEVAAVCLALTTLLDTAGPARDFEASYAGGATDATIRLFSAIVSWIRGDRYPDVVARVNYNMTALMEFNRQKPVGRMRNFRQLAELISWRISFLGTMLAAERHDELSPSWQRELATLAPRVRLGCASDAVPLFWPRSSNLRRPQARELLDRGLTAGVVAATYPLPRSRLPRGVYVKLRQDIHNYSRTAFAELAAEMTAVPGDTDVAGRIGSWWRTAAKLVGPAIDAYDVGMSSRVDGRKMIALSERLAKDGPAAMVESSVSSRESERVRISEEKFDDEFRLSVSWKTVPGAGSVLRLHGEYAESRRPKGAVAEIVFVQAFSDMRFAAATEAMTPQAVVRRLGVGAAACIVPCPWLPASLDDALDRRKRDGVVGLAPSLPVVTLASFLTVVTLVARGFVSGKSFFESIVGGGANRRIGMMDIEPIIEQDRGDRVPVSIMEKIVNFFEVAM